MKISFKWLKDYVSVEVPANKLAHRLTMAGLEVETLQGVGKDTVFELEITPNRPDCLNVLGIAREVSAIFNKRVKHPRIRKPKLPAKRSDVTILDKQGCPRYIGTVIKEMDIRATPPWIKERLETIGLRSINNVVDITNFVLMETGQPLHAFDYDKLIGGKVIVRRARKGEKIVTIDGIERNLDPSILVIADSKRPVAIAGVMGGCETEVTKNTKNILLESASFDPVLIRHAARAAGLSTDSSYRFERGVDIQMVEAAASRARDLIKDIAGGKVVSHQDLFPTKRKIKRTQVDVSINHINSLLGSRLSASQCKTILKRLDFDVKLLRRTNFKITSPSFRNDIRRAVDVVEEIARVVGYDNLPLSLPTVTMQNIPGSDRFRRKGTLLQAMRTQGFDEVITYTMTNAAALEKCGLTALPTLAVVNPLTQDQEFMRPHTLANLLPVVQSNINRGQRNLRLFEIGKIYDRNDEREVLSILLSGIRQDDWRRAKKEEVDFYDIKGGLDAALAALGNHPAVYRPPESVTFFSESQAADVEVTFKSRKRVVGSLGKVSPGVLSRWDIKAEDVYFAMIELEPFLQLPVSGRAFRPVSGFPAITRDISLAVSKDISFQQVTDIVRQEGTDLLRGVSFLEEYLGEKIPAGQRGLVFSMLFQSPKRTLTEDEVGAIHRRICEALKSQLGAQVR